MPSSLNDIDENNVEADEANSRRHVVVLWVALLGILVGAFALTTLALNSTVYSAGGFVTSYLQSLQRGSIDEALATPGVLTLRSLSTELLTSDSLGELTGFTITSDVDEGGGIHLVSYEATLGGASGSGSFQVLQGHNRFGLFSTWAFLQSPVSELRVTPLHDKSFAVNGIQLVSPEGANVATSYQVLTPGFFTVTHTSPFLTATPVSTAVTTPGEAVPLVLDIRASQKLVEDVQDQVHIFLDACATQEVLFPTGCPFGQSIYNQVVSAPQWSMVTYPTVTIEPGNDPGTWVVPETQATAHLTVKVRSLFDGSLSTFDEDVPFGMSWVMTIDGTRIDIQR
ncbi:MAG: hypothetical protein ABIW32_02250 [Terrimesophilobacter sp.]